MSYFLWTSNQNRSGKFSYKIHQSMFIAEYVHWSCQEIKRTFLVFTSNFTRTRYTTAIHCFFILMKFWLIDLRPKVIPLPVSYTLCGLFLTFYYLLMYSTSFVHYVYHFLRAIIEYRSRFVFCTMYIRTAKGTLKKSISNEYREVQRVYRMLNAQHNQR